MRLNKASFWLSTLLVLGGCDPKPELSAVTVTCDPTSVVAGQPSQCTASATDQDGKPFTVSSYTWMSSNESVAKVDSTGKATTVTAGTATISASATADGVTKQGEATLTVTQSAPQLSSVTVTCDPASVSASRFTQCMANAKDQNGQPFTVSGYTWASSNESVAKVDSTGRVTTFTSGAVTIRASATAGGVSREGQASLTVTAAQPTLHTTHITTNETWRASENPHVVGGYLEVTAGATLTLEAGVEIRFEQDQELRVTHGALRALGTQDLPIRMVANQNASTKGYWRGVVFAVSGSASELNHVTLSNCGRNTGEGACIALENQAAPVLRHVTARNSGTAGVVVADDGSAFGAGSTTLSVSGSAGYAMRLGSNQAATLPVGGTFTDNAPNAVELHGRVSRSQTWPNPGIPYVVNDHVYVDGETSPTLTISAGTVLRFGIDYGFYIGFDNPGELIVDGTADAPILFTAHADNPQPGHWRGVHLARTTSNKSRISHATIEYAGASGGDGTGNLNLYGFESQGANPVIKNVVVRKGSRDGFYLEGGRFGPDSTMLTARDNGRYAISIGANDVGTIPTGGTFSNNVRNAVEVTCCGVYTTQTWPNIGIPYVMTDNVNVGSASSPTLTISAGTELRFGADLAFSVGSPGDSGTLIAVGTAEAPIRFIPDALSPTKGHWRGLHFWYAGGSKLDYVTVTHAGAAGSVGTGNVNVYRELGAFVTNSTFKNSSGCGITVSSGDHADSTPVSTDYELATYKNTFDGNTGGLVCAN